jgi:hypothetical protein
VDARIIFRRREIILERRRCMKEELEKLKAIGATVEQYVCPASFNP